MSPIITENDTDIKWKLGFYESRDFHVTLASLFALRMLLQNTCKGCHMRKNPIIRALQLLDL